MANLKDFNHVDLLFPSKYAKAADLRGKPAVVIIESIDPRADLVMQGGRKDKKPVVRIKGWNKEWILNVTNARAIAQVYGNEVTGWIGKAVVIVAKRVEAKGEMVDALRVDADATRRVLAKKSGAVATPPPVEPEEAPNDEDEATRELRESLEAEEAAKAQA